MNTRRAKPNRKLLPYQVKTLRWMYRARYPRKFLLALFGISPTAFSHIVNFASYKEVR